MPTPIRAPCLPVRLRLQLCAAIFFSAPFHMIFCCPSFIFLHFSLRCRRYAIIDTFSHLRCPTFHFSSSDASIFHAAPADRDDDSSSLIVSILQPTCLKFFSAFTLSSLLHFIDCFLPLLSAFSRWRYVFSSSAASLPSVADILFCLRFMFSRDFFRHDFLRYASLRFAIDTPLADYSFLSDCWIFHYGRHFSSFSFFTTNHYLFQLIFSIFSFFHIFFR